MEGKEALIARLVAAKLAAVAAGRKPVMCSCARAIPAASMWGRA